MGLHCDGGMRRPLSLIRRALSLSLGNLLPKLTLSGAFDLLGGAEVIKATETGHAEEQSERQGGNASSWVRSASSIWVD